MTNEKEMGNDKYVGRTDLISRQSVIDMLDETKRIARQNIDGAVLMTFERVFDSLVNITNDLPTIQPEPHWIPVTERLPGIGEPVLDDCFSLNWMSYRSGGKEWVFPRDVRAWMPLPEAYKKNSEGATE